MLQHPGVPHLGKDGAVGLGEAVVLVCGRVVGVADKEHGAGIELVGEEELGEESAVFRVAIVAVEGRVELIVHVLKDRPDEAPGVELPRGLELTDGGGVEPAVIRSRVYLGSI